MSYDLMVFDPVAAPRGREPFLAWFGKTAEWSEGHGYDDPAATTPELQAWYHEMRSTFPNMNDASVGDNDDLVSIATDYSIAYHAIYAGFAWSQAERVYPIFRQLAVKHRVGFYDVSGDEGDGEIYFPGDELRSPSDGAWRDVAKQFKD